MVSKLDNDLAFQQQALGLRAHRQQILASNIANSDTPNFKARDFDFSAALKDAVAGRSSGDLHLARTSSRHIGGQGGSGPATLLYRTPNQASVDGNTVDMDLERSQFAENSVFFEAGLSFITDRIRLMRTAVQGNQ